MVPSTGFDRPTGSPSPARGSTVVVVIVRVGGPLAEDPLHFIDVFGGNGRWRPLLVVHVLDERPLAGTGTPGQAARLYVADEHASLDFGEGYAQVDPIRREEGAAGQRDRDEHQCQAIPLPLRKAGGQQALEAPPDAL